MADNLIVAANIQMGHQLVRGPGVDVFALFGFDQGQAVYVIGTTRQQGNKVVIQASNMNSVPESWDDLFRRPIATVTVDARDQFTIGGLLSL